MELLIKGARIVDCCQDFIGDVYIKDGIINKVDGEINKDCPMISGEGLVLLPSFIDMHCHFRDPGYTYKEDLLTGSLAALRGGYTAVNLMANTNPVCSDMDIVDYVIEKSKKLNLIDILQTVSITKNLGGVDISHISKIRKPVRFISDDGKGVLKSRIMLDAMLKAKDMGLTVISHAEDDELTAVSTRLSENVMTSRDIALAKFTGAQLHMAHVSTKEAMEDVIDAKRRGYKVTCEVAPHHIALMEENNYRVNPPLRTREDIDFIIWAIKEGYVDAIATDHAPHSSEDKIKGAPGISGIETSFSVCFTELVEKGHIDLSRLTEIMSKNPAKMMGLNKGEIKTGFEGDLVLVDINKKVKIESERFVSKGKNTPFEGMTYTGAVETTIKGGKILYRGEKFEYDIR